MTRRKARQLDSNKVFTPEVIRLNLMMSSLYLAAFELLKSSVIDGVKDEFLQGLDYNEKELGQLKDLEEQGIKLSKETSLDIGIRPYTAYMEMASRYEKEIGVRLNAPDHHAILPCSEWLRRRDVLSDRDIEAIKVVRDHRNQIAHELPSILVHSGVDVDMATFRQIQDLLHKVDVYWIRTDLQFDPATGREVDIDDIPDDQLGSGREAILQIIVSAVVDYARLFGDTRDPSDDGI